MKKLLMVVLLLLLSLLVACEVNAPQTPDYGAEFDAVSAPLPFLLPEATVFAVEVRGLARRWSDMRSIGPIADFQDRIFALLDLAAADVPTLVGDGLVVALVSMSQGRKVMPLALLRPDSLAVESLLDAAPERWTAVRARNAVWVGPVSSHEELASVARGDGTSLAHAVPLDESDQRLPSGGLIRGWVNPAALRECIRAQMADSWRAPLALLQVLFSADLEAMRWFGFRRDIAAGTVVTDAVAVYDTSALPSDVARLFDPTARGPAFPTPLPEQVVLAAAIKLEPEAALSWLRHVARRYPDSQLRNLEFWIAEFEERTGLELQRDLFGTLGENAWILGVERGGDDRTSWVAVVEAPQAHRAATTILALRDWSSGHVWVRTLGLAVPRTRETVLDGVAMHTIGMRTPFGELTGPTLAAVGDYLLMAADDEAIRIGRSLVEERTFDSGAATGAGTPALMVLDVRGRALSRVLALVRDAVPTTGQTAELLHAVLALVAEFPSISARCWYETDAIRMRGEIALGDWPR